MPVCDRGVIGQQLSTIDQQFFSFFSFLVNTLTLGGVGDAVALDVEDAVIDVLAGGGVGRVSAYNLQLGYRFPFGDDADTGGVNGDVTTEETTVGTDRGAGGGVRVIELVVLQAEVGVAGG